MHFGEISRALDGVPYISRNNARRLYDFILKERPEHCLELGFAHGASSLFAAAALDELDRGTITSVDIESSASLSPNIEELLERTGLHQRVHVVRERNSYTWFLKKELERDPTPRIDFCFIDGAKNWTTDGLAFFLVDKLLNQGGWILFDDYAFSYADYERSTGKSVMDGIHHRELGSDELEQAHVRLIFQLLVMQHPHYSEFRVEDEVWAWARKLASDRPVLRVETNFSLRAKAVTAARRLVSAARRAAGR